MFPPVLAGADIREPFGRDLRLRGSSRPPTQGCPAALTGEFFFFGIEGLVQQHFEIRLVAEAPLRGQIGVRPR